MKRSIGRVLTTHTGSLPRPPAILEVMRARESGAAIDETAFEVDLQRAVAGMVRKQAEAGIAVVNDGECGKPSFGGYVLARLTGFEARMPAGGLPVPTGALAPDGRDARMFPDYYSWVLQHNPFANVIRVAPRVCVGPITYVGHTQLARDIGNLQSALAGLSIDEVFLPAAAPFPRNWANEYYPSAEEYATAFADAMREEYRAILDAGLLVQIDDPTMVSAWDGRPELTLDEYRRLAEQRVEVLNYALRGLPEDRIRYHTCYGVNFGPRVSDLQLKDVLDILFKIHAGSYSFEAANPRHEHEWRLFETVPLPEGKVLIPGMVTHSNVMIEHPEVVADRIVRWAQVVGRENVMAGNDCGFASTAGNAEIPPTVAWAKLEALAEGARLATRRLWT
ncbi:MAG TPA: cobalamin-independent methionine synthase II family protein [Chloroflexota bacterium]|nr:cobalamin-independent methionine synthase II family protein [Chloroflexota bacterium]